MRDTFIGPEIRCAVCKKCHWDLRTGNPPRHCIYGGPFGGYVQLSEVDEKAEALIATTERYWIDPKLSDI